MFPVSICINHWYISVLVYSDLPFIIINILPGVWGPCWKASSNSLHDENDKLIPYSLYNEFNTLKILFLNSGVSPVPSGSNSFSNSLGVFIPAIVAVTFSITALDSVSDWVNANIILFSANVSS